MVVYHSDNTTFDILCFLNTTVKITDEYEKSATQWRYLGLICEFLVAGVNHFQQSHTHKSSRMSRTLIIMAQKELRFTLCYPEWLSDIQCSYGLGLENSKNKKKSIELFKSTEIVMKTEVETVLIKPNEH